jgi:hypothetical protein
VIGFHAQVAETPEEEPRYTLDRKLAEHRSWSKRGGEKDLWEWNPIHQPSRPYASIHVELSEMHKASAEGVSGTKKVDVM